MAKLPAAGNDRRRRAIASVAGVGPFTYDFLIYDERDLLVVKQEPGSDPVTLTLSTSYTVAGVGDANGGTITLTASVPVDTIIVMEGDTEATRRSSYQANGELRATTLNLEEERRVHIDRELIVANSRTVRLPKTVSDSVSAELPVPLADAPIGWNATATRLVNLPVGSGGGGGGDTDTEWGSDFDLPQDDTDIAPLLNAIMDERQAARIRITRYVPRQGEPDPTINSFLRVPAGHTLDRSQVSFRRGKHGRIGMSGSLVELPETGKLRLASAITAGDTTIYLRVPVGGSIEPLQDAATAGMDLVLRGQNDAAGNSIEKETIGFTIVDDTDDQNIEVLLARPTELAYAILYEDSLWQPNGPASDYSLVSVTVGAVLDEAATAGDITVELASIPAGLVAGGTVVLSSDELVPSGSSVLPYGLEVHRVRSIAGTTVTLVEPLTRDFPLDENPKLLLREAFAGATILCGHRADIWLEAPDAAPASRIDGYTMQYVDDCMIVEPWVDDAATEHWIRGSGVMDREGYNNRVVDARIFRRIGGGAGDHNGLGRFYSTFSRDERSFIIGARHGIINQGGISPGTFDYLAVDCATNAWDTHGCGTVGAILDGFEIVGGSALSSDNADQRGIDLGNTSHRSSDRATVVRNGVIRGFSAAGASGLAVRPPSADVTVQSVRFADCDTGLRLVIDDRAGAIDIDGVVLEGLTWSGCDTEFDQSQNDAPAWAEAEAITATTARPRYRTNDSKLYSASANGTTGATAPTHGSGAVSDGGVSWTYVAAAANRILNVDDFDGVPASRLVSAGTGLTGGGDLSADLSISLSSGSIASLALADSAVQPGDPLADGSVTEPKIAIGAVISEKIAAGAVLLTAHANGTPGTFLGFNSTAGEPEYRAPPTGGSSLQGTLDGTGGNITEITATALGTTEDQIVLFDQAMAIANDLPAKTAWGLLNVHASTTQTVTMTPEAATTVSDAVWGTPTGADVTITSAGAGLPSISAGQSFVVTDHSDDDNNGLYIATGSPTTSSLPATKLTGAAPAAAASEGVDIAPTRVFETGLNTIQIPPNGLVRLWMDGTLCRKRGDDVTVDFAGRDLVNAPNVVTLTGEQELTSKTLTEPVYRRKWLSGVSGTLTMAGHSGCGLILSGDVTIPTTAGFNCVLKSDGARVVTFNGTSAAAMATGDVMTIEVQSATVILAVLTPAASLVTFT